MAGLWTIFSYWHWTDNEMFKATNCHASCRSLTPPSQWWSQHTGHALNWATGKFNFDTTEEPLNYKTDNQIMVNIFLRNSWTIFCNLQKESGIFSNILKSSEHLGKSRYSDNKNPTHLTKEKLVGIKMMQLLFHCNRI